MGPFLSQNEQSSLDGFDKHLGGNGKMLSQRQRALTVECLLRIKITIMFTENRIAESLKVVKPCH